MSLSPGMRLGAYEVTAPIGEGGMGQVYRATDTKLKRQVAIKILTPSVAPNPDSLARFQREAELLAALNHPHIAGIYGVEEADGLSALVMEFVQGEDLSDRIARGALPLDEALPIAKQIADALEAAHEQGIIHRDLKPANIKLRDDGTVKVLDFGLAKMLEPTSNPSAPVSLPPTITTPGATQRGAVLGTPAYMSPEQARGKIADRRSDVWAFGCVLYEMLTGTRAFAGAEITDVLAAVVRDAPDWSRLPRHTPESVRRLLRRSLNKDRRQRLADMSGVRLELDDAHEASARAGSAATPARFSAGRVAGASAAALLLLAAIGIAWIRTAPSDVRVMRFDIAAPPNSNIDWGQPLSPDGRTVAITAQSDGRSQIWLRPLDSASARLLPGTEGATRSFWSPDSQHVAFFSDGNLKEVAVDGSQPRLIARGPFRDGAWSPSGVMLVGGQRGRPIMRVSERGGEPVAATTLDESRGEVSHDYPEFLPDGRHYIYMVRDGGNGDDFVSYVATLDSNERRLLPGIRAGVKYSPTGHLLFLRGASLMAQPFDAKRFELTGDAFPIAEQVAGGRIAAFSISGNGTLAFIGGAAAESRLIWFNRAGQQLGPAGPIAVYENPTLSPDGRSVAFERGAPPDVWRLELDREAASKITSDRSADQQPVWSPDAQALAFASNRSGKAGLYQRTLGAGSDERLLVESAQPVALSDWSRDGAYLAYSSGTDIWALPLHGDRNPLQVTKSPLFQELNAVFSPDGRWVAYQSDESTGITRSGEGDVYVQSFPDPGVRRQVSAAGGFAARWSHDGKELFYVTPDGMLMAASIVSRGAAIEIGAPKPLFRPRFGLNPLAVRTRYSVSKDGRFLMRLASMDLSIAVIINWFDQLNRTGRAN